LLTYPGNVEALKRCDSLLTESQTFDEREH
jgi:hypothetical protein